MGVPKLFRYLVERYPLILSDADPLIQPNYGNHFSLFFLSFLFLETKKKKK